ncbi:fibrinogen-like protein A [Anopheles nili]|uniref:fibrinogen-like protein A n=1 Tax=Anopheles nili TaxID=185578 RepID=UPI00237AA8CF|nr:fibrinogen-like protein A [Anopheles nili]
MYELSKGHRMVLSLLLVSAFISLTSATLVASEQNNSTSIQDRLSALENRITLRDEELAKMLQLLLANQKEILRLLQQPDPCVETSYATDGTQKLSGWRRPACLREPRSNNTQLTRGSPVSSDGVTHPVASAYQDVRATDDQPRSCREIPDGMSGEETIYPSSGPAGPGEPIEVYCDQDFEDGGWIVIQNRFDGFVNFNRSWEKYRDGFGDIGTEYWLGLDEIHRLTVAVPHEIAFVAESFRGERRWARYSLFEIGGETDRYRLQKLGVYSGTLGDEFTYNRGMEFSTYDQDHDQYADVNCALRTAAGWWHRSCTRINLNGMYGNESGVRFAYWLDWLHLQGLKRTRIMIREIKKRRK